MVTLVVKSYFLYLTPSFTHRDSSSLQNPPHHSENSWRIFGMRSWSRIPDTGGTWHLSCSYCPSLSYPFDCSLHMRFPEYALHAAASDAFRSLLYKLHSQILSVRRKCSTSNPGWDCHQGHKVSLLLPCLTNSFKLCFNHYLITVDPELSHSESAVNLKAKKMWNLVEPGEYPSWPT